MSAQKIEELFFSAPKRFRFLAALLHLDLAEDGMPADDRQVKRICDDAAWGSSDRGRRGRRSISRRSV